MAKEIAKRAQTLSLSENYESPFYKKAKECGLRTERSGKPDDISVIVARVMKEEL